MKKGKLGAILLALVLIIGLVSALCVWRRFPQVTSALCIT